MARAIWKGNISFGLVQIPVGLYAADKAKELKMTMLDRRNLAPVGYERVNKVSGDPVPWDEIVKGYEYDKGEYVVLGEEDFRRANVEATQTVDILAFVEKDAIEPLYFDKPYYLAPANKKAAKPYALLRETLRRTDRVGVAKVVIRTRQHLAAVLVRGKVLVLELIRFADEVRDAEEELELPTDNLKSLGVTASELTMAEQLVKTLEDEWDPTKYRDDYREDLLALIREKVKAGETDVVTEPSEEEEAAVRSRGDVDLMALLKKSVQGGGKPAAKSDGRARAKSKSRSKTGRSHAKKSKSSAKSKRTSKTKSKNGHKRKAA